MVIPKTRLTEESSVFLEFFCYWPADAVWCS